MFLVCGEALFDLFGVGEDADADMRFEGRMGGSPFNVAIGMARLGSRAALFTGVSTDLLGERLAGALEREGVDTGYLIRNGRRTTLSMVALNPDGGPTYSFYGVGSSDCSIRESDLPTLGPEISGLHFGSYSIAVEPVATALAALAEREQGRFISLDPNVRPTVEPDMDVWRGRVEAMRRIADVVKVSEEDIEALYPGADPEERLAAWATDGPALVVLTRGGADVLAIRGADSIRVAPPAIEIVDTVGAGDAFQAALLNSLSEQPDPRAWLAVATTDQLHDMIARASRAAAIACQRRGANPPDAKELRDQ